MKKRTELMEQYTFMTRTLDMPVEQYLDEAAPLIGRIVQTFNAIESSLDSKLCELISEQSDHIGMHVIHRRAFSDKVDLYKRFGKSYLSISEKDSSAFDALIPRLVEAGELRNLVVHAEWDGAFPDGYMLCKVKHDKGEIYQEFYQLTMESLENVLCTIHGLVEEFSDYTF